MCLAVPARIESVNGMMALCRMEGLSKEVDITLVPQVRPGDWVIVHVGFALQKIDETKAQETLELLTRIKRMAALAGDRKRERRGCDADSAFSTIEHDGG